MQYYTALSTFYFLCGSARDYPTEYYVIARNCDLTGRPRDVCDNLAACASADSIKATTTSATNLS